MTSLESSPGWHSTQTASASFEPLGARRLFLLGGIGLILVGMLFGDIFAVFVLHQNAAKVGANLARAAHAALAGNRSEEHTSELQSLAYLVCRLLLEKKKQDQYSNTLRKCNSFSAWRQTPRTSH